MQILERSKKGLEVWQAVLPFCQAPDTTQFVRWLIRFSDDKFEHAMIRASRKFAPHRCEAPSSVQIYRYITGVMLNMEQEEQVAKQAAGVEVYAN